MIFKGKLEYIEPFYGVKKYNFNYNNEYDYIKYSSVYWIKSQYSYGFYLICG